MPRNQKLPFVQSSYRSGMYDKPSLELPDTYCQNIENMVVDGDQLTSRGGKTKLPFHDGGFTFPGEMQGIHQFWDNNGTSYLIMVSEGRVWRYSWDGADPTEITGSVTLSNSTDARYVFRNYDGGCYFTDGINPMVYIADGSSNCALFSSLGPNVPSRASALEIFENSFVWGNFTDFDTDSTDRRYGTIVSQIAKPAEYRADQGARNDHNRAMAVQSLAKMRGVLLILMERAIRYATLDPAPSQLGYARTSLYYDDLTEEFETRGLVAPLGVQASRRGTFIIDRPGLHQIPRGKPPGEPQYISLPIETFWDTIYQARIQQTVAAAIPERNGILFCVPYGDAQTQNNRGIFFNIESWTDRGGDIEDIHPAFSIFSGTGDEPFSFNCLANIIDDHTDTDKQGRPRCLGGDYDGYVYYIDEGTDDDGTDITCKWTSPRFGDSNREFRWDELLLETSSESIKTLTAAQVQYGKTDNSQSQTVGSTSPVLGQFLLGTHFLGGQLIGTWRGKLSGPSRYTHIEWTVDPSSLPITIHKQTIRCKPGGTQGV